MYELVKSLLLPILRVKETEPEPLPGHKGEVLQIIRACPSFLRYKLFFWKLYVIVWTAFVVSVAFALFALNSNLTFLVVPLFIVALFKAAILYVAIRLDYEMRWYVLTEQSLLVRQGAWVIREICLTYSNAQNVQITQGPLQRLFGFSNVEVDTAGGGAKDPEGGLETHRAVLRGLHKPNEVRDLILVLLRRHRNAGLGDPDDNPQTSDGSQPSLVQALNEVLGETKKLRAAVVR